MTKLYINYSDIPSDEACWLVNTRLWNDFCYTYELQEGKSPTEQWSEAEVTQWLDIFEQEMVKDNIYY
jgi:hypothetical protein